MAHQLCRSLLHNFMQEMDWSTSAALMGMAGMLGIRAKLFAAQPEQLVYEDFDRSAPVCPHLLCWSTCCPYGG